MIKTGAKPNSCSDFCNLDFIEKSLAVRAFMTIQEVSTLMQESTASNKEKENDLFQLDINRMVRHHLIYLSFMIAKQRVESH